MRSSAPPVGVLRRPRSSARGVRGATGRPADPSLPDPASPRSFAPSSAREERGEYGTDPSAGSPTETLLRLLLSPSDRDRTSSHAPTVAGDARSEVLARPSTDGSDGRCVQRAGTYSARGYDPRLQGIPRSRGTVVKLRSQTRGRFSRLPDTFRAGRADRAEFLSVARVQPRTSKGITDLLSLLFVRLANARPSKKPDHRVTRVWRRRARRAQDGGPRAPADPRGVVRAPRDRAREGPSGRRRAPVTRTLTSRPESRSLSELTRQIAPPTKNGHAPPPTESRKSVGLSILAVSGPGEISRVESN